MKFNKVFVAVFFMIIALFTSACSAEDMLDERKYGKINIGLSNVEKYFGRLALVKQEDATDESEINGYFEDSVGMHGFRFCLQYFLDDNVDKIDEVVKITYVVDITIIYLDNTPEKSRKEKQYENLEFEFKFATGQRGEEEAVSFLAAPEEDEEYAFGESKAKLDLYYYDVSDVVKIILEPRYIKKVSGKIYINPPEKTESSGVAI